MEKFSFETDRQMDRQTDTAKEQVLSCAFTAKNKIFINACKRKKKHGEIQF